MLFIYCLAPEPPSDKDRSDITSEQNYIILDLCYSYMRSNTDTST